MSDSRRKALDSILQTIQGIRAEGYPQIPASLVTRILEIEAANEDSPASSLTELESEIIKASRGQIGR